MPVVATNLATNPSFEAAGATVVVRTNRALRPQAGAGWASNNSASYPVTYDTAMVRRPGTTSLRGNNANGHQVLLSTYGIGGTAYTVAGMPAVTPGETITVSIYINSNVVVNASLQLTYAAADNTTVVGVFHDSPTIQPPINQWVRISATGVVPANAAIVRPSVIALLPAGQVTDGSQSAWAQDVQIESGAEASPFFDGSTTAADDFTYAWTGTANASSSTQRGIAPATVGDYLGAVGIQSASWKSSGAKSLRIISAKTGTSSNSAVNIPLTALTAGKTYTILATMRMTAPQITPYAIARQMRIIGGAVKSGPQMPNTAGVHDYRWVFVGNGAETHLQLWNGTDPGDSDVWWDDLLVAEGDYTGSYFDGSTQNTPRHIISWTGAAHASTSVASTYSYLPVEYPDALSASRRCVWFGTTSRMTWLPMPSSGMAVSTNANVESGIYENGGGWGFRSAGSHRQYAFEFGPREASGVNGLDKYNQYASGYYASFAQTPGGRGTNYMLFADPAIFDQNVLPPHWASPALALAGDSWHHIGPYSSRAATPANTYDQPPATLTYSVDASTHLASMLNPRRRVIIPIPPTHRLSFGWSGTRTGAAGIGYSLYNHGGTITDVATPVAPINNGTLPGRIGTLEVSGQTAYAVEIYLKGTAAAQTISITSMMAELIPLWEPTRADGHSAGQHVAGKGHTGCMFADDAIVESYEMIDTYSGRSVHLKGLSTTLKEVGAWGAVA